MLLLNRGAAVDSTDSKGRKPLSTVLGHGYEILKVLLGRGTPLTLLTPVDVRRYHIVQTWETTPSASCCCGAQIDTKDFSGSTPLSYSARRMYNGNAICALLSSCGAAINATDSSGRTPLSHCSERGIFCQQVVVGSPCTSSVLCCAGVQVQFYKCTCCRPGHQPARAEPSGWARTGSPRAQA